ncbi:nucleoside diphosphate-linked moiety X motif 6 isoform X2 [Orussus abietinus]|uniref:nucleoside diphosphate-linked moiety X motif 6 isoform X2 n=1 Tax=Orussus abietinus TaxID=222816 RepID=UPI000C715CA1|nr:nucleoside diphosphate-linked moiety X motif 6 isoform X2 [Orussus abietinus]
MYRVAAPAFIRVILERNRASLKEKSKSLLQLTPWTYGMSSAEKRYFEGTTDRYNGVVVDSAIERCKFSDLQERLQASLNKWLEERRRTIWFRVGLAESDWIPVLARNRFKFHHAKEESVTMYRWLPDDQECNVPPYAHTNLGVGGFVFDEQTNEILVIQEKHSPASSMWKLPGGYVEPGEDIEAAVVREVLEETGIQTTFKGLLTFRHGHRYAFGCSDIYMIVLLTPLTRDIQKCEREISRCTWMKKSMRSIQKFMKIIGSLLINS